MTVTTLPAADHLIVLVGPYGKTLRYAREQRLHPSKCQFVTHDEQLHRVDPPAIDRIVFVDADELGPEIHQACLDELDQLRRLWSVRAELPVT